MEHIQLLRLIESDVAFATLCATSGLNDSLMREVQILRNADSLTDNHLSNILHDHVGSGKNVFEQIREAKDMLERLQYECN